MSDTPYRSNAEIAEEIPKMSESKPWPKGRKVLLWLLLCVTLSDASLSLLQWEHVTRQSIGFALVIHLVIVFFAGMFVLIEDVEV